MSTVQALKLLADTASRRCADRVERRTVAGVPALVAGRGPAFVFANACTPRGIEEPALAAFLGGVASAGLHAIAPELPDVRHGVVTPATVDALVRVAEDSDGALVLAGASTGGALAILAAADPRLAGRVALVSAIAPFADLANVLRLATTGHYADEGIFRRFPVEPRLRWVAERSLLALGDGTALAALLENDQPERFNELYAALPGGVRAAVELLSPARALSRVGARVDVAVDPWDTFFPPAEARALERAGAYVTRTPALRHVKPRIGPGLARFVRFTDRMLLGRPALAS
ncbi:MAG TPA: hypothetical protein VFR32_03160 [Gaiellaceae bacterium]|nr:hypothetical protein [Gaiellaceae bacterium]